MPNKFDPNMNVLRGHFLKGIYNGENISEAELNFTDLSIYSKNNTFFSRVGNAIKQSVLDDSITLTNEQIECLNLLDGNNLFLSAPTSFGKTYIALEFIARNTHLLENIIFVVSLTLELRIFWTSHLWIRGFRLATLRFDLAFHQQDLLV